VAAQRALELPVRMGIATGEAELRESDYFGTVLCATRRQVYREVVRDRLCWAAAAA
jgi:class 3 adenylate cyclase